VVCFRFKRRPNPQNKREKDLESEKKKGERQENDEV